MEKKIDIEKISADLLTNNKFSTYAKIDSIALATAYGIDVVPVEDSFPQVAIYVNDHRRLAKKTRYGKVIFFNNDDDWADEIRRDITRKKQRFVITYSIALCELSNDSTYCRAIKMDYEKDLDDNAYNLAIAILLPKDAMEMRIKDNYERTHYNLRAFVYLLAKEFEVEQHHVMNRLINLGYLGLSTGGDVNVKKEG